MGFQENHADCDHVLGNCSVFPGALVLCVHGRVQASCEACLDELVALEAELAELEELDEELDDELEGQLEAPDSSAERPSSP